MKRCLAVLLFLVPLQAQNREVVFLWPDGAPGSEGKTGAETPVERPDKRLRVTNVHRPSLIVYPADAQRANGTSVIVCPGGGHQYLSLQHEGTEIAEWFARRGVTAFVLKYRLARAPESTYTVKDHSAADARRALEVVRARAGEWKIDPRRVGMIGFSAGAEVAALAANGDGARPDFVVLAYSAFSETAVAGGAPPAFLVHANDDRLSAERSANYYLACKKAGVEAELHIYGKGGHGFGFAGQGPVATWPERLWEWMESRGLTRRP